jgi:hypothetical protein
MATNETAPPLTPAGDPAPPRVIGDSPEPILRFFKFDHLKEPLRSISAGFAGMAEGLVNTLPRSAERTVALRKLLESKDAAVRAALP